MALLPTVDPRRAKTLPDGLHSFFGTSSRGVLLTDQQGAPLYWNKSLLSLLGLHESKVKMQADELSSALEKSVKNSDNFEVRLRQVYSNQQNVNLRVALKDNRIFEVDVQWQSLSNGEQSCLWSMYDVSEEAVRVKYLQDLKDRYETALCGSEDGVWDWDLRESLLYLSPHWEKILIPEAVMAQKKKLNGLWDLCLYISAEERESVEEKLNEHMQGATPFFEVEFPIHASHLGFLWIRMRGVSLRNERKEVYRMSGLITDITDRKISDTRRQLAASHDRLTGLPNQICFRKKLAETLKAKSSRKLERKWGYTFSVLLLRLSRFSIINESFGPEYGDRVIKEVSYRLRRLTRQEDFLARLEGNKFAIILQNTASEEEIKTFADRIQKSLDLPIEIDGQCFVLGAKMGAILPPPHYAKVEDVLHECTKALACAKKGNEDLCIRAGTGLKDREATDFFLYNDLARKALQSQDFVLYFQPIIDIQTGKVESCEALLRLKGSGTEEEKDILNVSRLVHALEQSGQIVKVGTFVMREAYAFAQELESHGFGDCEIKVNISPFELGQEAFCDGIEEIFKAQPFKRGRICLEITENVFIKYNKELEARLMRLKNMGFRFALDDFGTGYSSFASLRDLPVDTVKIDRSFLAKDSHSGKDEMLVAAMVVMVHSLSLGVIAEGVESQEQLDFLKKFECDYAQGFLFSPAIPAPEFIEYLKRNRDSAYPFEGLGARPEASLQSLGVSSHIPP